jgi:hypothetical protein
MLIPLLVTCSNVDFAGNSGAKSGGEKKEEISDQPTEVSGGFGLTCIANEMEEVLTDYKVSCQFTALNGSPLAPSDNFDFDIAVTNTQNPITIKKAPQGDKNTFEFYVKKTDFAAAKIETKAFNPKNNNSEIKAITFDLKTVAQLPGQVASPVFSLGSGIYQASQLIRIQVATPGAEIYYTTDGTLPSCDMPGSVQRYSSPISLSSTTTIKAIGCLAGSTDSSIVSEVYTINANECGAVGNSCYDLLNIAEGTTRTLSSNLSTIIYVKADPSCLGVDCFMIWREVLPNGTDVALAKVLNANGVWDSGRTMGWQTKLNSDGTANTGGFLQYGEAKNLAGRACPHEVNASSTKPTKRICLYYDHGTQYQMLDLGDWSDPSSQVGDQAGWYEGNIQVCSNKGMRLPTLYETNSRSPTVREEASFPGLPGGTDGATAPEFISTSRQYGVPPVERAWTWTASAYVTQGAITPEYRYWVWNNSDILYKTSRTSHAVRCVLPSTSTSIGP